MDDYRPSSYGDAFAEVYDEWYGDSGGATADPGDVRDSGSGPGFDAARGPSDPRATPPATGERGSPTGRVTATEAAVERLAALAGPGPVLELGVGTGRLAIPLAARGLTVWGIDASAAMLARLAAKPGGARVRTVLGDMAALTLGPDAPRFVLAFVAANTLFNLPGRAAQAACFTAVGRVLAPAGRFVVEAFVPADNPPIRGLAVRELGVDHVVVTVSRAVPSEQVVDGKHVEISAAGVTVRQWRVWWATPRQLDDIAGVAGFALTDRSSRSDGTAFTDDSEGHVSVYQRR